MEEQKGRMMEMEDVRQHQHEECEPAQQDGGICSSEGGMGDNLFVESVLSDGCPEGWEVRHVHHRLAYLQAMCVKGECKSDC